MALENNHPAIAIMSRMQMLVWRMDLAARVFENLNEAAGNILSRDNFRFFKDSEFMKKLLLPEDLLVVNGAVAKIKERLPVQAVFRVYDSDRVHWFKLTGWPTDEHKYYEGTVEDISPHVGQIKDYFDEQNKRLFSIEDTDYPVANFSRRNT